MLPISKNKKIRAPSHDGFSLVEIIIAFGISGLLLLVANQMLSDVNKWMASISTDADLVEIAQSISSRVNCDETYKKLGISSGLNPRPTTQVQLYDKNGNALFISHSLGGGFTSYKKVAGDWIVSSIWTGKSFAIRVGKAQKDPLGWAKDPVTRQPLSFSARKHTLFGDSPNIPLCPKRSNSTVLSTRLETTSGEINRILGKTEPPGLTFDTLGRRAPVGTPPNAFDNTIMLLTPLTFVRGCHHFCRKEGNNYNSGILVGLADWDMLYDANGNLISTPALPVGQSRVICECYL